MIHSYLYYILLKSRFFDGTIKSLLLLSPGVYHIIIIIGTMLVVEIETYRRNKLLNTGANNYISYLLRVTPPVLNLCTKLQRSLMS